MSEPSRDRSSSRRAFLSRLLTGTAVAVVLPALYAIRRYLKPPPSSPATTLVAADALPSTSTEPLIVRLGAKDAALVRARDGSMRALSLTCTHTGCSTHWQSHAMQYHCPCHNGIFDVEGNVVSGPPRSALERLRVEHVRDGVRIVDEAV